MSLRVSQTGWSDGEQVKLRIHPGHLVAVADYNAAEGLLHPRVVIAREDS